MGYEQNRQLDLWDSFRAVSAQATHQLKLPEMIEASIRRKLNGKSQDPQFEGDLALDVLDSKFPTRNQRHSHSDDPFFYNSGAEGTSQGLGVGSVVEFQALSDPGRRIRRSTGSRHRAESDGMTSWVTLDTQQTSKKTTVGPLSRTRL